mmetsp:Transcript_148057/g.369090  ORF Transcript_148057/g.369090 Transcript_148057/m.369090 type:complete len:210 (-) Transcript_148057:603-1232(-)
MCIAPRNSAADIRLRHRHTQGCDFVLQAEHRQGALLVTQVRGSDEVEGPSVGAAVMIVKRVHQLLHVLVLHRCSSIALLQDSPLPRRQVALGAFEVDGVVHQRVQQGRGQGHLDGLARSFRAAGPTLVCRGRNHSGAPVQGGNDGERPPHGTVGGSEGQRGVAGWYAHQLAVHAHVSEDPRNSKDDRLPCWQMCERGIGAGEPRQGQVD